MSIKQTGLRLAMWSGPRNISTAMMRSFENRRDSWVSDEPLYAHYLLRTGLDHPGREEVIASLEHNWDKLTSNLTGPIPECRKIWYQKQMTHHYSFEENDEWLDKVTNCFLIRHPAEVIVSFLQRFRLEDWEQIGFPQQIRLFHIIRNRTGQVPVVIDAKDILKDPKKALSALCEQVGISFMEEMLSWPSGSRETDGVWGKHWYENLVKTSGFTPYKEKKVRVPEKYQDILDRCLPIYEELAGYGKMR